MCVCVCLCVYVCVRERVCVCVPSLNSCVVVGPNGVGKSTIAGIVSGELTATTGAVLHIFKLQ